MTDKQPEALRLAELLDDSYPLEPEAEDAAAELRRLHEVNEDLIDSLKEVMSWINNWSPEFTYEDEWTKTQNNAEAALAKAEGK